VIFFNFKRNFLRAYHRPKVRYTEQMWIIFSNYTYAVLLIAWTLLYSLHNFISP